MVSCPVGFPLPKRGSARKKAQQSAFASASHVGTIEHSSSGQSFTARNWSPKMVEPKQGTVHPFGRFLVEMQPWWPNNTPAQPFGVPTFNFLLLHPRTKSGSREQLGCDSLIMIGMLMPSAITGDASSPACVGIAHTKRQ